MAPGKATGFGEGADDVGEQGRDVIRRDRAVVSRANGLLSSMRRNWRRVEALCNGSRLRAASAMDGQITFARSGLSCPHARIESPDGPRSSVAGHARRS